MKIENLRSLIKESIQEYISEVEESGNIAAQEAKIRACDEAIANRMKKINMEGLDEAYHDMMSEEKMKELKTEVKALENYKKKATKILEKLLEKKENKGKPKVKKDEEDVVTDAVTEEAPIDETDVRAEMELEEAKKKDKKKEEDKKEMMNEAFLKMQKLAGVITEAEYNKKKSLIETLFLGDLEKMKKSENSKEYTDKEIEDMSLENAKKLYNSVKKSWDVPANNKLKKQLEAKIEKEDPKFFKQTKK